MYPLIFGVVPMSRFVRCTDGIRLQPLCPSLYGRKTWCERRRAVSDAIQRAKARRAEIAQELELIDQYLSLHARLFSAEEATEREDSADQTTAPAGQQKMRRKNDPQAVADRADEILRQHGRPLQRGDLVRRIEKSGMPLFSKDKNKYLGTILWRHRDRFTNIEDQGYWIKGLDVEACPSHR